jgi:glycosyltransferase involved in cell wall biosynthesis
MLSKKPPLISIVIPTYNRRQLLSYTLDSIVKQQFEYGSFEVIVVDDGSSDGSEEVAKQYEGRLDTKYCFQEDKGYRVASARNLGIARASGEIIVFVDSGVLLASGALKAHWEHHASRWEPSALIGYVYGFDQSDEHALELMQLIDCENPDRTIDFFQKTRMYLDIREAAYERYQDRIDLLPAPWVFFWTCNVSVRRDAVLEAGGFDENFDLTWGVEDQDLGLRLCKKGVSLYLCRQAAAIHYPHYKDMANNMAQDLKNRQYFHRKHQLIETEFYLTCDDFELNEKLIAYGTGNAPRQQAGVAEKKGT